MIGDLLEPGDIQPLLRELARRVSANRARVGIRVVGGAAIALLNADRRVTQDIDVLIHPAGSVQDVVDEMAAEHGLRPDWLNDAVKAKTPFVGDDDWVELLREGDVSVFIASTPLLLAMKLSANRGIRDTDDIHFLLEACGVESLEQAQEIYERYHHQEVLSSGAQARVESWLSLRRPPA